MKDKDIAMIIRTLGCVCEMTKRGAREYVVYFVTSTHEYTNTMGGQVSA